MSLDADTLAFMRLRNRGHTTESLLQGQLAEQNEQLDRQREVGMRALAETQNASQAQIRSLESRVQGDVLAPAREYADALENRIKELQIFKEKNQALLTQEEAVLVEKRALQSSLKDNLNVLQRELAFRHDPIEDFVSGYGSAVSKNLAGWKDIKHPGGTK